MSSRSDDITVDDYKNNSIATITIIVKVTITRRIIGCK